MKAARALHTATKGLSSRAEISQLLARPTWSVSELFEKTHGAKSDPPTAELLTKLLKEAGLNSVRDDPAREAKLLQELDTQLTFVGHISEVSTEGIEPLVRIGGPPVSFSYEQLVQPVETAPETVEPDNWNPVDLAVQNNGSFFVLREGLVRE